MHILAPKKDTGVNAEWYGAQRCRTPILSLDIGCLSSIPICGELLCGSLCRSVVCRARPTIHIAGNSSVFDGIGGDSLRSMVLVRLKLWRVYSQQPRSWLVSGVNVEEDWGKHTLLRETILQSLPPASFAQFYKNYLSSQMHVLRDHKDLMEKESVVVYIVGCWKVSEHSTMQLPFSSSQVKQNLITSKTEIKNIVLKNKIT